MKVLDHFDFERCRAHLDRNHKGSVILTMKDDREFTLTDLDEQVTGSSEISGTRFPDHAVRFRSEDVTFAMLLPVDPRVWDGVRGEVDVSTRQRRRRKRPSLGANDEQHASA